MPFIKRLSCEPLCRCLQQQGIRTVYKSDATFRSNFMRHKGRDSPTLHANVSYVLCCTRKKEIGDVRLHAASTVDPTKQDCAVYKIPWDAAKSTSRKEELTRVRETKTRRHLTNKTSHHQTATMASSGLTILTHKVILHQGPKLWNALLFFFSFRLIF